MSLFTSQPAVLLREPPFVVDRFDLIWSSCEPADGAEAISLAEYEDCAAVLASLAAFRPAY
jgi:hypothetical protein